MARGKNTCRILKEIRRQIAEANDIAYVVEECKFKGDCLGTCPKCEAEVRYLESQLRQRQMLGKAVVVAGLSLSTLTANAQAQPDVVANDTVKVEQSLDILGEIVETMPAFPGGNAALMKYLSENVHYPDSCVKEKIQGRVVVEFVVNEDGHISDAEVMRSVDPLLDAEALRVVSAMPNWIPGELDGKSTKSTYFLPINYKLSADE